MKVALVAGTRPNFMKISPILRAIKTFPKLTPYLIHTGQHYDHKMSDVFFRELRIPEPDVNLGVGSGSHAVQTAKIMTAFEQIVVHQKHDLVLVVGDVTSTMACALVAAKLQIPVAHVEAGIRSFDRTMPEEINRIVTDAVSHYLFPPTQTGVDNLLQEGISNKKIFLVGNVMIDTLLYQKESALQTTILKDLTLEGKDYALMTMHRPSNVDDPEVLERILRTVEEIQNQLLVIFPMHPRTRARIMEFGLQAYLDSTKNLRIMEPIGYLESLNLMIHSKFVLTDSGGMQEETAALNIPCLVMRENTERVEMVEFGTSVLVGSDPDKILNEVWACTSH